MSLVDFLFPKFCIGCGFLGAYICLNCQKKLSCITADRCLYCDRLSYLGLTHPSCRREGGVDGVLSIYHYNNFLKSAIKSIKYRLATKVFRELCLIMEPETMEKISSLKKILNSSFSVLPIPLHANRLRVRGFNQARLVAVFFNRFLNLEISEILVRKKDTRSQAQLRQKGARYQNTLGAFALRSGLVGESSFLLVDDLVTSGSTIKSAAGALKKAGAKKVIALTLARG